jgi:hypothetical protein
MLLPDKELKHFDSDAKTLVLKMQAAGWRGHMTNTGHAFMYAPDGATTASVSRSSLRGRSGKNATAVFDRWIRQQKQAREAAEQPNAFGLTAAQLGEPDSTPIPDIGGKLAPTALVAEMRRSEAYIAFVRKFATSDETAAASQMILPSWERPREWAVFDITVTPPVLVAHGSKCDVDQAWLRLQELHPEYFGVVVEDVNGGQDMKVYVCNTEGCTMQFESAGALNLHRSGKHPELLTCPVEGCGREVRGHGGLGAHMRSHRPKVVQEGATVAPPPQSVNGATVAPPITTDVVMSHLEYLPQGADAEQMVAAIRAIVAAPLVEEVRRLRDEAAVHLEQIAKLEHDNREIEARLSLMREALSV